MTKVKLSLVAAIVLAFCAMLCACGNEGMQKGTTTTTAPTSTSVVQVTTTTAAQSIGNVVQVTTTTATQSVGDAEAYFYESKKDAYTLHTVTLARKAEETAQKAAGVTASVALPKGLSVQEKDPEHTFRYIDYVFGMQYIVNSEGACVGVIGYLYDESSFMTPEQWPTIYSNIRLGSILFAEIPDTYTIVKSPSKTENAMSQMFHSAKLIQRDGVKELGKDVRNPLMLCYDQESKYAVVVELDSDVVTDTEVVEITQSLQLQPLK